MNNSLNNSCASDINEAELVKIQGDKRMTKRHGLREKTFD